MIVVALLLLQLIAAKCVFDRVVLPRVVVWCIPLLCYAGAHFQLLNTPAFLRMVALCCVLMAGMKWVVYAEWRRTGGEILSWSRWGCFACLWFGMDPAPWTRVRSQKQWRNDCFWGAGCLFVGVLSVALLAYFDCTQLQLLFVTMSVGFHYGALRLLVAFWKQQGYGVRALFRNPLEMRGFADFWSRRWNLAYSQMMARAVLRPLRAVCGRRGAQFGVFAISGVLHELAITVPVQAGYGMPTLFFLLQGVATSLEKQGGLWMAVLCGVSLVVGLPLLFPETFVEEVILPARNVLKF
ncbi:wax synthase family protein [Rubritalea spongiae]|uniref:wax synthase family protein n=1 Tax=Rubritalea spongiae TaxID=430797 RepID=UPI0036204ADF